MTGLIRAQGVGDVALEASSSESRAGMTELVLQPARNAIERGLQIRKQEEHDPNPKITPVARRIVELKDPRVSPT